MNSGISIAENMEQATKLIEQAAAQGAQLAITPENTCHLRSAPKDKLEAAPLEEAHPMISHFAGLAKKLNIWLIAGSICVRVSDTHMANRCYAFSNEGKTVGTYDKIHLFDVDLPNGERFRESDTVAAGNKPVVVQTPWGGIGLTICYDVRFPKLYRALAKAGADILIVPAAFAALTGRAHWEVLLRARAIENGCFVLAAGQTGVHENGRLTHGHSLVVNPWGQVVADGGEDIGIVLHEIDLTEVQTARHAIPALKHEKEIAF